MEPTSQPAGVDMTAIREALARRAGQVGMGQGPTMPTLGQTTPGAPSAGVPQTLNPASPQPLGTPPTAPGQQVADDARKVVKTLMTKLLQVL